jgi:ADP-heptose:LPS heptosyltransferase
MKKRHPHKEKVLLVNITRLGDMLQATPTIAGIKQENPNCHITVLVEKQFEDVCHVIPNIDRVVSLDLAYVCRSIDREKDGIIDAFEYLSEFVDKLRAENFDYCLNMSSSAYTALLLKLVGIENNGGWTSDEEGNRVIESEWARLFATSVFHQNRQYNSLNLVDVFRCSADVDLHPKKLLIKVEESSVEHCKSLLQEASFTNTGPLIAVQAGASQGKRQWAPARFIEMISLLVNKYNARVVLTGSSKERSIIDPIVAGCASPNVISVAGRTSVPQLSAMLQLSDVLVTGDTGPMHMAVAVGTPVVSMFLASAYGFETGPYSEGNIVIQPVIGCGPCNPNKPCSRPDCHDTISPELVAELAIQRTAGEVLSVDPKLADPRSVTVYRSAFDNFGFCDLVPINAGGSDPLARYRKAYRRLWLDDLGGFPVGGSNTPAKPTSRLAVLDDDAAGIQRVRECAVKGQKLLAELVEYVQDVNVPASKLADVNKEIVELDRKIEEIGYENGPLAPMTRMFVFAKENLQGSDPLALASQMERIYGDLGRRADKFRLFLQDS